MWQRSPYIKKNFLCATIPSQTDDRLKSQRGTVSNGLLAVVNDASGSATFMALTSDSSGEGWLLQPANTASVGCSVCAGLACFG